MSKPTTRIGLDDAAIVIATVTALSAGVGWLFGKTLGFALGGLAVTAAITGILVMDEKQISRKLGISIAALSVSLLLLALWLVAGAWVQARWRTLALALGAALCLGLTIPAQATLARGPHPGALSALRWAGVALLRVAGTFAAVALGFVLLHWIYYAALIWLYSASSGRWAVGGEHHAGAALLGLMLVVGLMMAEIGLGAAVFAGFRSCARADRPASAASPSSRWLLLGTTVVATIGLKVGAVYLGEALGHKGWAIPLSSSGTRLWFLYPLAAAVLRYGSR